MRYLNDENFKPCDEDNKKVRTLLLEDAMNLIHRNYHFKAEAIQQIAGIRNDVLVCFDSADIRKFSVGRPALQETELQEIFFRDDKYSNKVIFPDMAVIDIDNPNMVVTSFKKAQNSNDSVLRFFNSSFEKQSIRITLPQGLIRAVKVNAAEVVTEILNIKKNVVHMEVAPAEIVTINFR